METSNHIWRTMARNGRKMAIYVSQISIFFLTIKIKTRLAPQNDLPNLSFVKDINVVCKKNDQKLSFNSAKANLCTSFPTRLYYPWLHSNSFRYPSINYLGTGPPPGVWTRVTRTASDIEAAEGLNPAGPRLVGMVDGLTWGPCKKNGRGIKIKFCKQFFDCNDTLIQK